MAQAEPTESTAPRGAGLELSIRHHEMMFHMTNQMLGTDSLQERTSLALDTITAGLGYQKAAIAFIDEGSPTLRVRMAVGFPNNSAIERLEMPLELASPAVSAIFDGRPGWIRQDSDEIAPFGGQLTNQDLLVLPLFGWTALEKPETAFARKQLGDSKYWEPESMCLGVLYIGADRDATDRTAIALLQHFADRIGIMAASAIKNERLSSSITKLERERQWVESVMKSVADPIVLTNLDNEILLQNKRAEELFSGSEDASEGKRRALKMNDLLFSAYLSSAAVGSTEALGRDLTLVDPIEGSDIHFEVISTSALNDQGRDIGMVSVFRDVTDLIKANEELARNYEKVTQAEADARRERDHLNRIVENVGHPVVVTDASGNFILFNRRAGLLFHHEQEAAETAEALLIPEDAAEARAVAAVRTNSVKLTSFISGLASETDTGRQAEIELIDPNNGESLPMEITSVEVLDANGQVTAVVSVLHDLSQLRELERRRVEQKLFESEKLAAVGTLAASIAHEVNNPLEAIKNSLHLLSSGSDVSSERFLSIAIKETERVSKIIHRMLGFARRSGGVEWTNVNQLIEETVALVERKLKHAGIRVVQKLDARLPAVHGYPDQLRQVFLNIILNAQQSIEGQGGIEIRTSIDEASAEESVIVEISDTGCGISEEEMAHIFEPFFSRRTDGTGLGLWVTQNIVRQHGGHIEIANRDRKGSTFRLILPVDSAALTGA
ncbi:MAG TPA: ATP-binding protein [Blastocatellia bacterium]|nr:ATP-binding protein [Blastocatellia bacterium]